MILAECTACGGVHWSRPVARSRLLLDADRPARGALAVDPSTQVTGVDTTQPADLERGKGARMDELLDEALRDAQSPGDLVRRQQELGDLGGGSHVRASPAEPPSPLVSRVCCRGRHRPGRPVASRRGGS